MKSHVGSEVSLLSSYLPVLWNDVKYIWNSYLYSDCRWKWRVIITVNLSNWKEEAWKYEGFNGIRLSFDAQYWKRWQQFAATHRKKQLGFPFSPLEHICAVCVISRATITKAWLSWMRDHKWQIQQVEELEPGPYSLITFVFDYWSSGCRLSIDADKYRLLHVKSLASFFIHEVLIPYRERASLRAIERYGIENEWIKTMPGS